MTKKLFAMLFACCMTFTLVGCGGDDYSEIPEIDPEEAAQQEEEINKQMEAEMEKQMGGGGR